MVVPFWDISIRRKRPVLDVGQLPEVTLRGLRLVVVVRVGFVLFAKGQISYILLSTIFIKTYLRVFDQFFHEGRTVLLGMILFPKLLDHLSHQLVTRLLVRVTSVDFGLVENGFSVKVGFKVVVVLVVAFGQGLVMLVVINRRVLVVVVRVVVRVDG